MKITGIDLLIKKLLQYPSKWTQRKSVLEHKNGFSIFTRFGPLFLSLHRPDRYSITLRERWRLYQAIKEWRKLKLLRMAEIMDV